jgi:hypothetical protein
MYLQPENVNIVSFYFIVQRRSFKIQQFCRFALIAAGFQQRRFDYFDFVFADGFAQVNRLVRS